MKVVRSNKKSYLIIMFFMILSLFLLCNKNTDIETKIQKNKNENIIDREQFAMYVENNDGEYVEYNDSNYFPEDLFLNISESYCVDEKDKKVENVISYLNNKITVTSNKTVFCSLYFTQDASPTEFTFYIGGETNPEYVTNTSTILYLNWLDLDISEYCIVESQGIDNCTWHSVSGTSINQNYTLTAGEGTKTLYAYIKDINGNTSPEVSDNVILDDSMPTNNSIKINSNETYASSTSVTLTLSSTGATEMCISNTANCSNWETYVQSKNWTLTSGDGAKTVYVWYRDAAGNTSNYEIDSIMLDTVAPTITASVKNNNTADADISYSTNEHTILCINKSSTKDDMTNCVNEGYTNCNPDTTWSTWDGTITSSGTYYVHAKDDAGNISVSSALTLTKLQSFGEYLIANKPTGFNTTTSYGGLYRFIGTSANNYVKIGSVVYRVIGVTSDFVTNLGLGRYQVKLIKSTSTGVTQQWNSSTSANASWTSTTLYSYLQGSNVLTNTSVIPSGWSSYITSVYWYNGSASSVTTAQIGFDKESASKTSAKSKIGLMYVSDYYWAYVAGGGTNCNKNDCTSWLTPTQNEWAMSRYGTVASTSSSPGDNAWEISSSGKAYRANTTNNYYLRPVFYLSARARRTSGSGTSSDPYVLSYS